MDRVQLQFELPRPQIERSQLIVQQKAAPKGLKMEVEVPKPTTKEMSHFELQQMRRVEAVETQRQEYTIQVSAAVCSFLLGLIIETGNAALCIMFVITTISSHYSAQKWGRGLQKLFAYNFVICCMTLTVTKLVW